MVNLFATEIYRYLQDSILEKNKQFHKGEIETLRFPDGEVYHRIVKPETVRNQPAVLISGTINDAAVMETYNLACELVSEQCSSLHLVIPYFGYSTMERATKSGEVVPAKNIARMLSTIPLSAQGNFIYLIDLHSLGVQYYFEGSVHTIHLISEPIMKEIISGLGEDIILASTDMGRAKWIEKMSQRLNLESAYLMKERVSGSQTRVIALSANVKGRNVAIYDDMIRSGSSIINAAQAYKEAGANKIYVLTTHGVFVPGALDKMKACGLIERIYCTNTHPNAIQIKDEFVSVKDISSIIMNGLLAI